LREELAEGFGSAIKQERIGAIEIELAAASLLRGEEYRFRQPSGDRGRSPGIGHTLARRSRQERRPSPIKAHDW
jgi:hypothetical protein